MAMLLDGRLIAVTGAGAERGIGRATTRLCVENGARVVALDRSFSEKQPTKQAGLENAWRMGCDITSEHDCEEAAKAISGFGPLDGVIHCAGIAEPLSIADLTREKYEQMLDVNLWGMICLTRQLLPAIQASPGGSIVCISSVAGQRGGGFVGGLHYAASKAGVLGFMRGLARELGPQGIRVNAVSPGLVDTDMTVPFMEPKLREQLAKQTVLQRIADPSEIASVCMFLVSDLSTYVTGVTLDVNGGLHIH